MFLLATFLAKRANRFPALLLFGDQLAPQLALLSPFLLRGHATTMHRRRGPGQWGSQDAYLGAAPELIKRYSLGGYASLT
jgi:hypothetical protein